MSTRKINVLIGIYLLSFANSRAETLFDKYAAQYQITSNSLGPIAELKCGPDFSRLANSASYGTNFCSIRLQNLDPNTDFIRINMFAVTDGKVQTLTNLHANWGFIYITNNDPAGSYEYPVSSLRVIDDSSYDIPIPNPVNLVSRSNTRITAEQIPEKYPLFNFITQFIPYKDVLVSFGQALDTVQPAQILAELQICERSGQCSKPSYASVSYQR